MKLSTCKRNILTKILMIPILLCLNGCIYLVVGGLGALGGYVVSPDTVEGLTENDKLAVWDTAVEVVSLMGHIREESEDFGVIVAEVSKATVTINVIPMDDLTTKLNVKARRNLLPKISVAQDVFVKIMTELNE